MKNIKEFKSIPTNASLCLSGRLENVVKAEFNLTRLTPGLKGWWTNTAGISDTDQKIFNKLKKQCR